MFSRLSTFFGFLLAIAIAVPCSAALVINELDSDTPAVPTNDSLEFVELFETTGASVSLNGYSLVFFNGNGDVSYTAIDLDGFSTSAIGFFLAGNPLLVPVSGGSAVQFPLNTLQNGADAVALYLGDATSFPAGTALTTANLVDAVVYDTADADDAGLLALLVAGGQVDEAGGGPSDVMSIGRLPNGAGAARDTTSWTQLVPTPGALNVGAVVPEPATAMLGLLGLASIAMIRRSS